MDEPALLERARAGDDAAFEQLVAPYRAQLHAHCYRLLASAHDADDAVQDALIGAWRGIGGFEGRSSLRGWLYRIATNAALRVGAKRPKRQLSLDVAPACTDPHALGEPLEGPVWVEPYLHDPGNASSLDPASAYDAREAVELAFVAALQHLPASQRAVLLLREVLAFSAAETAQTLDLSVPAVNSQLQRARATMARRLPDRTQQNGPRRPRRRGRADPRRRPGRRLGGPGRRCLRRVARRRRTAVHASAARVVRRDESIRAFLARMFQTPWRLDITAANGQPALVCWQGHPDGTYHPGGLDRPHPARRAGCCAHLLPRAAGRASFHADR